MPYILEIGQLVYIGNYDKTGQIFIDSTYWCNCLMKRYVNFITHIRYVEPSIYTIPGTIIQDVFYRLDIDNGSWCWRASHLYTLHDMSNLSIKNFNLIGG